MFAIKNRLIDSVLIVSLVLCTVIVFSDSEISPERVTDIGEVKGLSSYGSVQPSDSAQSHHSSHVHNSDANDIFNTDPGNTQAQEHMLIMQLLLNPDGTLPSGTIYAKQSGQWSDASIWSNGQVPGANADVFIPDVINITYDVNATTPLRYVHIDGTLQFAIDRNTKMFVDTIIAAPGSVFTMGTIDNPIPSQYNAEIVIRDNGDLPAKDQEAELSRGVVLHGTVRIHGTQKEAYLPMNLAATGGRKVLTIGSTRIPLKGDLSGWQVGDEVVIMGTSKGDYQDEERTITAINGQTITLNSPLQYMHDTPSFQTNNVAGIDELDIYVGNATRNVTIRSENANQSRRGHLMIMHSAGADVRYAHFDELGRTDKSRPTDQAVLSDTDALLVPIRSRNNPEGRYPLHFHRSGAAVGSTPFVAIGNSVTGSPGWGIVQHDSHGAVNYNFVYDITGGGIVSEDGNETGEWIGNFVTSIFDGSNGRKNGQGSGDSGFMGVAFESQSRVITQQDNIAANVFTGWNFIGIKTSIGVIQNLDVRDPRHPFQQNPSVMTAFAPDPRSVQYNYEFYRLMSSMSPQFVEFRGNEMIAIEKEAMISWHRLPPASWAEMTNNMADMKVWRSGDRRVFTFTNYRGSYHITDSLFVDTPAVMQLQEKSTYNSLVNSHLERSRALDLGTRTTNENGVLFNITEVNPISPIEATSMMTSWSLPALGVNEVIKFNRESWPEVGKYNISEFTQVAAPSLNITNGPLEVGPSTGFTIRGDVIDSFGTRPIGEQRWHSGTGDDGVLGTVDDKFQEVGKGIAVPRPGQTFNQHQNYPGGVFMEYTNGGYDWSLVLDMYGTFQKNGNWVMPMPIWINDLKNGVPYPYMYDFKIVGASTADLQEHELANYPEINLTDVSFGNPNIAPNGSFKDTRTYYQKPWRVPIPTTSGVPAPGTSGNSSKHTELCMPIRAANDSVAIICL